MPEICRFFGIVIRMFVEPSGGHNRPHFHGYYQDDVVVLAFDVVEILADGLPRPQQRLVDAWAEMHRGELLANWASLQAGRPPFKINPLR